MPTKENAPRLRLRTLSELSSLQCEYFTCPFPNEAHEDVLVVRFSGDCGYGSGSNNDCAFMGAMVKAGLEAFDSLALVLDFECLGYEWGDMMGNVIAAGAGRYLNAEFPTAVIVSDKNRKGLTSLVEKEMGRNSAEWLFESLDQAIDAVDRKKRKVFK